MKQTFEKRIIGDCTLYLGDCLELLRAGPGKPGPGNAGVFGKIGAIVSDPPYGIGFQHGGGGASVGFVRQDLLVNNLDPIHGDDQPFDPAPWIEAAPFNGRAAQALSEPRILLWGVDNYKSKLPDVGTMLAWDKHLGVGSDDSFADCEWAWCGRKVKREVFRWLWKGVICRKTDLDLSPTKGNKPGTFARVLISQKPVELMRWCID